MDKKEDKKEEVKPGRFAYMGTHPAVKTLGYTFKKGVAVLVEDGKAVAKLRGNDHFSEMDEKGKEIKPADSKHDAMTHGTAKGRALAWVGEPSGDDSQVA